MEKEPARNKKVNLMTKFTHDSLLIEIQKARKDVSDSLLTIGEAAGSESNWHDNPAFDDANIQHDVKSSKLAGIEARLKDVEIIIPSPKTDTVAIGNLVVVRFQGEAEDETFTILGSADSGRKPGWISFESPLGSNLVGKKEGEEVSFSIHNQEQKVKILRILPGEF
jgi:transcription elongation factor GreA